MPITVPGIAKLIISANSKIARPGKRWRTISQAVKRPTAAVSGAARSAIRIVVQKLFHATPVQRSPPSSATPKARW